MKQFKPNTFRLGFMLFLCVALFGTLFVKLFIVQFINANEFNQRAKQQYRKPNEEIPATRGEIFDRNGIRLVTNSITYDLVCEPEKISNPDGMGEAISSVIGMEPKTIQDRLKGIGGTKSYTIIKKNLDSKLADKIRSFGFKGIWLETRFVRSYPQQNLASPLIGFTGNDNHGKYGLEIDFDKELSGESGLRTYPMDSKGIAGRTYKVLKPVLNGKSLYLTIDNTIQFVVEEELERTCREWNAKGGACVIMNPQTGEIIACVSYPTYNLNDALNSNDNQRRNRSLNYVYEPGSVFKGIITAAALELGKIDDNFTADCAGRTVFKGYRLFCNNRHGHQEKLVEELKNSCNMAFMKIGQLIGKDLCRFVNDFGFGKKAGTGAHEESGLVKNSRSWDDVTIATVSYGQGVSVTPLQLAQAYSALANGGVLMKPILIQQIYDPNKGTFERNAPQPIRQVVSKKTADHVLRLLTEVVDMKEDGVHQAKIPGYSVAGKTGTTPKTTASGDYQFSKFDCSFCGIVPSDPLAPQKLVVLVVIDEPYKTTASGGRINPFGSTTAAPCFKRIAERILSDLRIAPKEIK